MLEVLNTSDKARVSADQKEFFQRAATLKGQTLSEFVIDSTHQAAAQVLQEHEPIRLSRAEQIAFVSALLDPPKPGARLRQAAENYRGKRGKSLPLVLAPSFVVPLEKGHDRSVFDCGNEQLNRYLKQQARQDADKYIAAPFVLLESDAPVVRGYYTLSSSLISLDGLPPALIKKLPRYDRLPVTLLGRLARDKTIPDKGLGEFLLLDALQRSFQQAQKIASMAVVVDARHAEAERLYRHFDFPPFQRTPLRLFLPARQLEALLSGLEPVGVPSAVNHDQ